MSEIAAKLDRLLSAWGLFDADGPIVADSDAMSDLVDDIMRTVRDSLADSAADAITAHVRDELGGSR